MAENVDLTLLAKLARDNLAETGALRREVGDVRTLSLQTVDYMRRMEQRLDTRIDGLEAKIGGVDDRVRAIDDRFRALGARMASLREDLELMIKSELMGRLAHFETRMENLLHERLSTTERAD